MTKLDKKLAMEELSKALDGLTTGKPPGLDTILAEVIKCAECILLNHLYQLLCQCWEEERVPQDMRNRNTVTLSKGKGDRSDCNDYQGISLLSNFGKIFVHVVLNRLQQPADKVYPESQCRFRSGRSSIDMIFLQQLQKCKE